MKPERLARLAAALRDGAEVDGVSSALERVLRAGTSMLGVTGAGLAVVERSEHLGAVAVSDPTVGPLDDLQFTLGEGPCIDADRSAGPVLEPDLARASSTWPAFAPAAVELGCHAVFTFPLRVGAVRVGVLSLYRRTPGELSTEDLSDALTLARVVTHVVLSTLDGASPDHLPERLDEVLDHRRHVHQATGMVAAQLGLDAASALARLRAFAWSRNRPIDDVADEVVRGALRFDPP